MIKVEPSKLTAFLKLLPKGQENDKIVLLKIGPKIVAWEVFDI